MAKLTDKEIAKLNKQGKCGKCGEKGKYMMDPYARELRRNQK